MFKIIGICCFFITTLIFFYQGNAFALDCPKMPEQIRKNWEVEVNVAVAKIGPVKAGEVKLKTDKVVRDLFESLPDAGRIYLEQMMYAAYCSALRDDKISTEIEKAKLLKNYNSEVRKTIGRLSSSNSSGKRTPDRNKEHGGASGGGGSNLGVISMDTYNKLMLLTEGNQKIIENLLARLDEKDKLIQARDEEIEKLGRKYAELNKDYHNQISNNNLSKDRMERLAIGKKLLDAGDIEGAKDKIRPRPPMNLRLK